MLVHVPPGPPAAAAPPVGASRDKRKCATSGVAGTRPPRDAVTTSPVAPVGGEWPWGCLPRPPRGTRPPDRRSPTPLWPPLGPEETARGGGRRGPAAPGPSSGGLAALPRLENTPLRRSRPPTGTRIRRSRGRPGRRRPSGGATGAMETRPGRRRPAKRLRMRPLEPSLNRNNTLVQPDFSESNATSRRRGVPNRNSPPARRDITREHVRTSRCRPGSRV